MSFRKQLFIVYDSSSHLPGLYQQRPSYLSLLIVDYNSLCPTASFFFLFLQYSTSRVLSRGHLTIQNSRENLCESILTKLLRLVRTKCERVSQGAQDAPPCGVPAWLAQGEESSRHCRGSGGVGEDIEGETPPRTGR